MTRTWRDLTLGQLTLALTLALTPVAAQATDSCTDYGLPTDQPVVGDWNGDGTDDIGIFRNAHWELDWNGNGTFDGSGIDLAFGYGLPGDHPVVGDWNGDGTDDIGIVRAGNWHLDLNGNKLWDGCAVDRCYVFGFPTDRPVVGDWNGDGSDEIGIFRHAWWALDLNGDGVFEDGVDINFGFGLASDTPVPGDWNGDGTDEIAVHRPAVWSLDLNGNRVWDGIPPDDSIHFSNGTGTPVVGNWDGSGAVSAGMVSGARWAFDDDDSGVFEGCGHPPVAQPDWATTEPGAAITIEVTANDTDPDGDIVRLVPEPFIGSPDAQDGTVVRTSDTSVTYTPDAGFLGQDSFRYRIWDGLGNFHSSIVTVTINTNQPPVAVNDFAETNQGQNVEIDVLANDYDPDAGDSLSLPPNTTVSGPHNGTAGRISTTLMEYRPHPNFVGTDTFQYRVHDSSGAEAIARVWVTVHPAPDEPEITEIGPDLIPYEAKTQVTVTGLNFDNPSVYVGTTKENPNDPDRVFPTATLLSVNGDQTSMQVEIDARATGVEGWYALYVETAGGGAVQYFRVIPDGPVVDAWTPVEGLAGDTYILTVSGVNLEGANVTPSNPNIEILDLDNTDPEGIYGILYLTDGAPVGDFDIEIERNGMDVVLPLRIVDNPAALTKRSVRVESQSFNSRGEPVEAPPIYLQDPSFTDQPSLSAMAGEAVERSQTKGGLFCFSYTAARVQTRSRILFRLFDLDTLQPVTQAVLDSLQVGDSINLGTTVVASWRTMIFQATIYWCLGDGIDGRFCFSGEFGYMVPFVGGQVFRFDACFGIQGDPVITLSASGSIWNFEWSSTCNCVTVNDLFPNSPSGERISVLDVLECGQATLEASANGIVFTTDFYILQQVGQVSPTGCGPPPPPPPSQLRVFLDVDGDNPFGAAQPIDDLDDLAEFVPGSDLNGSSVSDLSLIPQVVELVAAYVDIQGDSAQVVAPPAGVTEVEFTLSDTSAFVGVASNWPVNGGSTAPDYHLDSGGNQATVSFDADNTARITLFVNDYGGFTTVEAKPRGTTASTMMRIPQDEDGNLLPDAGWKLFNGTSVSSTGLNASMDGDSVPGASSPNPPTGRIGDGLSVYEEYRGFIVRGQHRRTNPTVKDVFISSNLATGIAYAFPNLPLAVHRVHGQDEPSTTEYNSGREVNFNHSNSGTGGDVPGHSGQKAIRALSAILSQACHHGQRIPIVPSPPGTPNDTLRIEIDVPSHSPRCGIPAAEAANEVSRSLGHEIGHALHICHRPGTCSDGGPTGTALSIMSNAIAVGANGPNDPASQYNALDQAQIRLHNNP